MLLGHCDCVSASFVWVRVLEGWVRGRACDGSGSFLMGVLQSQVDNFWDLQSPAIQHCLLSDILACKPFFIMLSPPCTHLCQYMFSNWGRMDGLKKYDLLHEAIGHIDVSCWVARIQNKMSAYYCIENPEGSQAWNRGNAPGLYIGYSFLKV